VSRALPNARGTYVYTVQTIRLPRSKPNFFVDNEATDTVKIDRSGGNRIQSFQEAAPGVQDKVIQAILRHSNVAVNAMQKLENATNMRLEAADRKSAGRLPIM